MTWSVNKYLVNGKPTFFLSFSFFLWFFFSLLLSSFFSLKREKRKERVMIASSYKIFSLSLPLFLFLFLYSSFSLTSSLLLIQLPVMGNEVRVGRRGCSQQHQQIERKRKKRWSILRQVDSSQMVLTWSQKLSF